MTDREKWILGVAGSVATLGLGYLIWRHENAVSQQEAAQNAANQDAANQAYAQELEQSLAVGSGAGADPLGGGGGYVGSTIGGSAGATVEPTGGTGGDSNLAAILAAFFPNGTSTTGNNGSTNNGPSTDPTPAPPDPSSPSAPLGPAPRAKPVKPVAPITGIQVTGGPVPYEPPQPDPIGVENPIGIDGTFQMDPTGSPSVPVHVSPVLPQRPITAVYQ